jgi:hypothetical protein
VIQKFVSLPGGERCRWTGNEREVPDTFFQNTEEKNDHNSFAVLESLFNPLLVVTSLCVVSIALKTELVCEQLFLCT